MSVVDKKALRHEQYRKNIPRSYIAIFVAGSLLFVMLSYAFFGFYLEHWYTGPARLVARVLPLPAVIVQNDIVWYREVAEFANVFQRAQEEGNTDVTDPFASALERTVSNAQLEQFATQMGVRVTRGEIQEVAIDDEDLAIFLHDIGWSEAEYRRYIVEPLLYAQKAEEVVYADETYQQEALKRIKNVQQDLSYDIQFEDLAKQYSDDVSGPSGGHLGYYTKDQMPEGLELLFDADVGVPSEILETDGDFVIAQVYDVVFAGGQRSQVALQIIAVQKTGLNEALEAFAQTSKVRYLVR